MALAPSRVPMTPAATRAPASTDTSSSTAPVQVGPSHLDWYKKNCPMILLAERTAKAVRLTFRDVCHFRQTTATNHVDTEFVVWRSGNVVRSSHERSYSTSSPVSTGMGDRLRAATSHCYAYS